MIYVVGSGPAGVACAKALLDQGLNIQMLDVGIELEPSIQDKVRELGTLPPDRWDPSATEFLRKSLHPTTAGLPVKLAFGSDFSYRETETSLPLHSEGVDLRPSFARGGLSTVWGAAVLPYRAEDIKDWPIPLSDLEPHYKAILEFTPYSAVHDTLENLFPLYANNTDNLQLSRQSRAFLQDLGSHQKDLNKEGIFFGKSRLAVRAEEKPGQKQCVYCGLCIYGCPYQCIYCSDQTLMELMQNPRFSYTKDTIVKKVVETGHDVTLETQSRRTRETKRYVASRVFLACGILSTTQILLNSLGAYNHPLPMSYSQHFMFPFVRFRHEPRVQQESLNTLTQVFLEVIDPNISEETVHLQIYGYNDLYPLALKNSLAHLFLQFFPPAADAILGRLLMVQGYLHSKYSGGITVSLEKQTPSGEFRLALRAQSNPQTRPMIRRLLKKLSKNKHHLGGFPLSPWLEIADAGRGFHTSGTFPMCAHPNTFESDCWGTIAGFKRVHAVDATVLPSAPATTITLSVMANAHRIGSHSFES